MFRLVILSVLAVSFAAAQEPLSADIKWMWGMTKNNIIRSGEKMPAEGFLSKPSDDVRTYGDILAHVADANYMMCSAARGEKPPVSGIEKKQGTPAQIVQALKESFAYCDEAYSGLTDAKGLEIVKFFGRERTRAGVLMFNIMHDYEHYGNLVTYMRIKGIVPPSSEPRPAQPKK